MTKFIKNFEKNTHLHPYLKNMTLFNNILIQCKQQGAQMIKNPKRSIGHNSDKHNSGFSLFELIIVIAIIAVASAIATPNIISWRQNVKMKGAVNSIYGGLQYAKFAAIRENNWIAVQFYPGRYEIFFDDGDQILEAGERVIKDVTLPAGVTIASTTFFDSTTSISDRTGFDRRGLPDMDTLDVATRTGRVSLLGPGAISRQITINRLGLLD